MPSNFVPFSFVGTPIPPTFLGKVPDDFSNADLDAVCNHPCHAMDDSADCMRSYDRRTGHLLFIEGNRTIDATHDCPMRPGEYDARPIDPAILEKALADAEQAVIVAETKYHDACFVEFDLKHSLRKLIKSEYGDSKRADLYKKFTLCCDIISAYKALGSARPGDLEWQKLCIFTQNHYLRYKKSMEDSKFTLADIEKFRDDAKAALNSTDGIKAIEAAKAAYAKAIEAAKAAYEVAMDVLTDRDFLVAAKAARDARRH